MTDTKARDAARINALEERASHFELLSRRQFTEIAALKSELAEAREANRNCISLALHESRLAAAEKERDHWHKKYGQYVDKWCDLNKQLQAERERAGRYSAALERIAGVGSAYGGATAIAREALEGK